MEESDRAEESRTVSEEREALPSNCGIFEKLSRFLSEELLSDWNDKEESLLKASVSDILEERGACSLNKQLSVRISFPKRKKSCMLELSKLEAGTQGLLLILC